MNKATIALASLLCCSAVCAAPGAGASLSAVNVGELAKSLRLAAADMPSAAGAPVTYKGASRWTRSSFRQFDALEQLGVQKAAEDDAVAKCLENGMIGCAPVGSQITSCNGFSCEATAVARALALRAGATRQTVKGASRWTKSSFGDFSPLERLGVLKAAQQDAVMKCQAQGLLDCASVGSQITSCNGFACEASAIGSGLAEAGATAP